MKANSKKGFTLTEAVISMAIIALIFVAALSGFLVSIISCSLAKHKSQAIYVAQGTIENLRKLPYASITGSSSTVSIDSKGTPDNYADDLTGTQIVAVYNDSVYYKRVIVRISWKEVILGSDRTMYEYCGTYIANDPQAN